MKGAACIVPVVLLAACAEAPAADPGNPAAGPAPAGGFELRMHRGACYGRCPVYELALHADGTVEYRSDGGTQHGQADAASLAALRQRLADADLPWGDYTRGTPAACGAWATDMPGVTIDAYVGGRWRSIRHDLGCSAAPAALKALEQEIDDAAGSRRWVGGRAME
jgi:hypothetical protein